jgi:hypothetical protein
MRYVSCGGQVKRDEVDGALIRKMEMRKSYKILFEKPEDMRPFCKRRCRWKNIKMDLKEIGNEGVD